MPTGSGKWVTAKTYLEYGSKTLANNVVLSITGRRSLQKVVDLDGLPRTLPPDSRFRLGLNHELTSGHPPRSHALGGIHSGRRTTRDHFGRRGTGSAKTVCAVNVWFGLAGEYGVGGVTAVMISLKLEEETLNVRHPISRYAEVVTWFLSCESDSPECRQEHDNEVGGPRLTHGPRAPGPGNTNRTGIAGSSMSSSTSPSQKRLSGGSGPIQRSWQAVEVDHFFEGNDGQ
ncbi:hypothetical protein BDP27DRAFT_1361092 [Rhodocollybia butyracea]|uniref:Uncharacterized protein n=1 Tax=Rhodocollybia butyracea TaxID=206335 RepID=A0A9P5PZG7_9AGAR|nr:hypothetical protein BDP27DRAFT_1361092 [Rhodocollybia butyracea]